MATVFRPLVCSGPERHHDELVRYDREGGPPACPDCGSPRTTTPADGSPPTNGYARIKHNGDWTTTGELDAHVKDLRAQHPDKVISVDGDNDARKSARLSDNRQRLKNHRREAGIDLQAHTDERVATLTEKQRGLERGSLPSNNVLRDVDSTKAMIKKVKAAAEKTS
jgi:hypothetical protein